eukprot:8109728-Heterocapsa_arctica.AAC.1
MFPRGQLVSLGEVPDGIEQDQRGGRQEYGGDVICVHEGHAAAEENKQHELVLQRRPHIRLRGVLERDFQRQRERRGRLSPLAVPVAEGRLVVRRAGLARERVAAVAPRCRPRSPSCSPA